MGRKVHPQSLQTLKRDDILFVTFSVEMSRKKRPRMDVLDCEYPTLVFAHLISIILMGEGKRGA